MRRGKGGEEKKGAPAWMNTYGDMVTLLLTFFVLLYSFSSIDASKWEALVVSLSGGNQGTLQQAAEIEKTPVQQSAPDISELEALQKQLEDFQKLYENLKSYVDDNNLATNVVLSKTDSEIQIRFIDNVLFDSGSASLKPMAIHILSKITLALKSYEDSIEMVRIEGHTDNVAINTKQFPSNWELSTSRAVEVLRFLIENQELNSKIVSAVGYGEHHAIGDNNTPEGRSANRRVDFVIARATKKVIQEGVNDGV